MNTFSTTCATSTVALLAEGVDRNVSSGWRSRASTVALLAEGVDRNTNSLEPLPLVVPVALLAEGVDRNNHRTNVNINNRIVALLAEGVDRNLPDDHFQPFVHRRPPHGGRG